MAQGTFTFFDEFLLAKNNGIHDFSADVFRLGFINNTLVPTAGDATPTWGDYSANQQSGGNFPATPDTIAMTSSEAAGIATVTAATNLSYAKNASNPTAVYWAILYNTSKTDQAVGFIEIDAAGADGTAGLISVTWGANLFTSTQA